MDFTIGDVALRTGLTERTLRYYEELGLLSPARDAAGRRRYDADTLDRLSRIRLHRDLGTPLVEIDVDADGLAALARRHLADLDDRLAALARRRERARAVDERLQMGENVSPTALLDLLAGLGDESLRPTRRITLLVYRDLAAAHAWLVEVFGFAAGELTVHEGVVVHGEVFAGDGAIWLHPESGDYGLASPRSTGGFATACLAVHVDDVDQHHDRVRAVSGVEVLGAPVDQPYGLREYSVRDLEGHLWSFQQPIDDA
ncbi:MerR family transcriptional regulator [Nocardioides sp. R-C-SC26]|uniref:MerR family transcriptional regulator n=1 Tax=Nocardioides sp. R-C-SC26 TaxID=2870414 RepID=UPI001E4E8B27|nr:MerR family transcriptional regulator [Nocardioides sp. R-C-SC26]